MSEHMELRENLVNTLTKLHVHIYLTDHGFSQLAQADELNISCTSTTAKSRANI